MFVRTKAVRNGGSGIIPAGRVFNQISKRERVNMIQKAIILAAGKGTRFLPYTRVVPKEMLPVVDVPAIRFNIDEAVASGIKRLCIVTNSTKYDLNHYFEREVLPEGLEIEYVFQDVPLGTGDAVLKTEAFAGGDPVVVMNGDDLMYTDGGVPVTRQLIDCYERHGKVVIGVQCVDESVINKYSAVKAVSMCGRDIEINGIIEKPEASKAPSMYAALGRYVVTGEIYDILKHTPVSKINGEIILTDALNEYAEKFGCFACDFEGRRYDLGSKRGYLTAVTEFALRSAELGEWYKDFLSKIISGEIDYKLD